MPVSTAEARARIEDELGDAVAQIEFAAASLGDAYERLDDATADRLEAELYRPVQKAFGRAKRAHAQFCERFELTPQSHEPPGSVGAARDAKGMIERAVAATEEASRVIAELQDSMLPIEAGDAELRSGLTEVRELVAGVPLTARELLRSLGR